MTVGELKAILTNVRDDMEVGTWLNLNDFSTKYVFAGPVFMKKIDGEHWDWQQADGTRLNATPGATEFFVVCANGE